MKSQMMNRLVRQGDVLLKPILRMPSGVRPRGDKDGIVLAYGEVTGHAHAIHDLDNCDVLVGSDGRVFLKVKASVDLRHEEHSTIQVLPGNYEVVIQREYSPEETRDVQD